MTAPAPADVVVFVLAAGTGSRLGQVTAGVPKPLIPLGGVPILERNVRALAAAGFRNLIVNVHHLADEITGHFGDGSRWGVAITYSHEPELLGTAGALLPLQDRLQTSTFMVLYGDNLFDCDMVAPLLAHEAADAVMTITWIERPDPGGSGVLRLRGDGTVTELIEKPGAAVSGPAPVSAGLLVAEPRVLDVIPHRSPSDLARDVVPALLEAGERVQATPLRGRILWIDTPNDLRAAENSFAGASSLSGPPTPE